MSKVYIEGFEMPKSCKECPFFWVDSKSVDVCGIYYELKDYYRASLPFSEDERKRICPLREEEL